MRPVVLFHRAQVIWIYLLYGMYFYLVPWLPHSGLVIGMTQEDLADILGLSRVQITRELTGLRNKGIVETSRGKLHITDLPKLSAICTDETLPSQLC